MSETNGNDLAHLKGESSFEADGCAWTFSAPTKAQKAAFQDWCHVEARKGALEWKGVLPQAEYHAFLAAVNRNISAGAYGWGNSGWLEMVNCEKGAMHLAWLMLQTKHGDITRDQVQALAEAAPELFGMALRDVLGVPDPTKQAPAAAPTKTTPAA